MADEHNDNHTGQAAEGTREAAERGLRGEHNAVPPSDLPDGKHERSHAAHLKIEEEMDPQKVAQGSARNEPYPGNRRQP